MSSLQKFHRRTNNKPAVKLIGSEAPVAGAGFWLGGLWGTQYIYVAPKSTEILLPWGSYGTVRGTNSDTDGLTNTNTLYSFGSAAHPAAYYAKTLTTGGYNTWYLPATAEMMVYTASLATPFATSDALSNTTQYSSSTERNQYSNHTVGIGVWGAYAGVGGVSKNGNFLVRAVRRA
jgi:hypothetical protein